MSKSTDKKKKAYEEGYQARLNGDGKSKNRFIINTKRWKEWLSGWNTANSTQTKH